MITLHVWLFPIREQNRALRPQVYGRCPNPGNTHQPRGPRDRTDSFSLERMKKNPHAQKTILAWNFHSWFEIFILAWNVQSRPCFSAAREGLGMKKPFSIEHVIPYWKLKFFNIASRDWFFFNPGAPWDIHIDHTADTEIIEAIIPQNVSRRFRFRFFYWEFVPENNIASRPI